MPNNQNLSLKFSDDTVITPINLQCCACFVDAGMRCVEAAQPVGVRSVDWFHYARESALRSLAHSAGLKVTEG